MRQYRHPQEFLVPGQQVDFWLKPPKSTEDGWRGPAEILSVNEEDGNLTVRMQGRTIDRQGSEAREHIPYFIFASAFLSDQFSHLRFLQATCEQQSPKSVKVWGG